MLVWIALACLMPACAATSGVAQDSDLRAFVGRWQIDLARTTLGRGNVSRSPTFTFVFRPQGAGLSIDIYENYSQAAPSRSAPIIPDRRPRACESSVGCQTVGGVAAEQSFAYFQLDPHMLVRVFYTRGRVSEYSTYAVSSDGKTFTMIAWGAENPDKQNIQVFVRMPGESDH